MVDQIEIIRVQEIRKNDEGSKEGEVNHVPYVPNYCYMLHLVTIIGVTTVSLVPQTLIPRHNSIYYPNYWYENAIAVAFVGSTILSVRTMLECFTFTKEKSIVTMNVGLKMYACIFHTRYCIQNCHRTRKSYNIIKSMFNHFWYSSK